MRRIVVVLRVFDVSVQHCHVVGHWGRGFSHMRFMLHVQQFQHLLAECPQIAAASIVRSRPTCHRRRTPTEHQQNDYRASEAHRSSVFSCGVVVTWRRLTTLLLRRDAVRRRVYSFLVLVSNSHSTASKSMTVLATVICPWCYTIE